MIHRRDWRTLWRHCRCGWRGFPCPEVHGQMLARARCGVAAWDAAVAALPDPPVPRPRQRPGWDAPTWPYLANGRPGNLTPGQLARARAASRPEHTHGPSRFAVPTQRNDVGFGARHSRNRKS
jgi:hypothetical protein